MKKLMLFYLEPGLYQFTSVYNLICSSKKLNLKGIITINQKKNYFGKKIIYIKNANFFSTSSKKSKI